MPAFPGAAVDDTRSELGPHLALLEQPNVAWILKSGIMTVKPWGRAGLDWKVPETFQPRKPSAALWVGLRRGPLSRRPCRPKAAGSVSPPRNCPWWRWNTPFSWATSSVALICLGINNPTWRANFNRSAFSALLGFVPTSSLIISQELLSKLKTNKKIFCVCVCVLQLAY